MKWLVMLAGVALAALSALAASPTPGTPDAGVASDGGLSPTVRILIQTVPAVDRTVVSWGGKLLGVLRQRKPLIVERPRDSGPLDIVLRAQGYVPVHTRAYTFTDGKLYVRLTPVGEKKSLFGYRTEIPDAGAEAGSPLSPRADGGPPPN